MSAVPVHLILSCRHRLERPLHWDLLQPSPPWSAMQVQWHECCNVAHLTQSMPSLLTTRWLLRGGDPPTEAVSAGFLCWCAKALAPLREFLMGLSKLPEVVREPKRLPSLHQTKGSGTFRCKEAVAMWLTECQDAAIPCYT